MIQVAPYLDRQVQYPGAYHINYRFEHGDTIVLQRGSSSTRRNRDNQATIWREETDHLAG